MRSLELSAVQVASAAAPVEAAAEAAAAADAKKKKKVATPVPGPQSGNSYGYAGKDCVALLDHRKHGGAIDETHVRQMKNLLFAPTHPTYRTLPATMGHPPTNDELDGVWNVLPFILRDNTKFARPMVAALFQPWENAMNETISEPRLVYMVYGTDTELPKGMVMYNLDAVYSQALSANVILYSPSKPEWCKEPFIDYQAKRVILELKKQLQTEKLVDNSEFRVPSDHTTASKVAAAIAAHNLHASLLVFSGCGSTELDLKERADCAPFVQACNREYAAGTLNPLIGRLTFGTSAPPAAPPAAPPKPAAPPVVPKPASNQARILAKGVHGTNGKKAEEKKAVAVSSGTLAFGPRNRQTALPTAPAAPPTAAKRPSLDVAPTPAKKRKRHRKAADDLEYSDASLSSGSDDGSGSESSSEEEEEEEEDSDDDDHSDDTSDDDSDDGKKAAAPVRSKPGPKPKTAAAVAHTRVDTEQPPFNDDAAASGVHGAPKPAKARTAKIRRQQIVDEGKRALSVLDRVREMVPISLSSQLAENVAAVRQAQFEYGTVGKVDEHTNLIMELTQLVLHLGTILTTIGSQNDSAFPDARLSRCAALNMAKVYLTEQPEMENLSKGLADMLSRIAEMQATRLRVVQETERMGAQLGLRLEPSGAPDLAA